MPPDGWIRGTSRSIATGRSPIDWAVWEATTPRWWWCPDRKSGRCTRSAPGWSAHTTVPIPPEWKSIASTRHCGPDRAAVPATKEPEPASGPPPRSMRSCPGTVEYEPASWRPGDVVKVGSVTVEVTAADANGFTVVVDGKAPPLWKADAASIEPAYDPPTQPTDPPEADPVAPP